MSRKQAWWLTCSGIATLATWQLWQLHLVPSLLVSFAIGLMTGVAVGSGIWFLHHDTNSAEGIEHRFLAAHDLFNLMENRIKDLEYALDDANVPIPRGRADQEQRERIAEGHRLLFGEDPPERL
jgi:hypothetical protein